MNWTLRLKYRTLAGPAELASGGWPVQMQHPSHDHGLTGLDHVEIYVRDRPKAVNFFARQLGLDILSEHATHTELLCGDQVLRLRDSPKGNRNDGIGLLSFRVSEWTGLRNRLKRARLRITEESERSDGRSIRVKAPERLRVELFYRTGPPIHVRVAPVPVDPRFE